MAYQHDLTKWDVCSIVKRDRDAFNLAKRASICSCLSVPFSFFIDAASFEIVLCDMRCDRFGRCVDPAFEILDALEVAKK